MNQEGKAKLEKYVGKKKNGRKKKITCEGNLKKEE